MYLIDEGEKLDKIKEHLKRNAFAYAVGLATAGLIGAKAVASKKSQEYSVKAARDIAKKEIKKAEEIGKINKELKIN